MRELTASVGELRETTESSKEEAKEAGQGFVALPADQYWVRGPARIDGDSCEIVLDENRAEHYLLYQNEGLLFELAGLGDGDKEQKALAFVRRYGLLWHEVRDVGSGKCRESLEVWFKAVGYLRFAMALYQSLRESVRIGSTEPLRKFDRMMPDDVVEQLTDEIRLGVAHKVLADMITDGLEDCKIGVGPNVINHEDFVPGKFGFSMLPSNLLDAAWAEFTYLVGTRAEIETCPGCGSFFSPESGKQKYCTKSCASTSRWRRWKNRQVEQSSG